MATGGLPFHGETSGLIFNKALEKDRELRYQHASDMRTDLKRLKRETESRHGVAASSGTVAAAQESGSQAAAVPQPAPASASTPSAASSASSGAVKLVEAPVVAKKN